MATTDYTEFAELMTEMAEEFGWSTAVYTEKIIGDIDVRTQRASVNYTDTTVDAILGDVGDRVGEKLKDGSTVIQTDKRVFLPVGVTPEIEDKMKFGDLNMDIMAVKEVNPGGTIIMYDLVCRG